MASEKQIAANRMNAYKSRGPRSIGGKARASRNAIRHGLAANFWNDLSAGYAIETMTELFRKMGYAEQNARLVAVAEYETRSVLKARSKIIEALRVAAHDGIVDGSLGNGLRELQSIDRYERRTSSRKKRAFRQLRRQVEGS
jgi:hypothetical protein